jgi:hypothetical protein
MTSRRSPPRRLSGNSATLALLLSLALAARAAEARSDDARGGERDPLQESHAGVEIDWRSGTLTACGGAAADLRMPSVDLARPGAERRARAAALGKLRAALATLPLGGGRTLDGPAIDRAAGRARAIDTQYQSNGGAIVRLEVHFADWIADAGPVVVTLAVPAMRLSAAPRATVGGQEIALGAATFRIGAAPSASNAHAAHLDRAGRLVIDAPVAEGSDLAAKLGHSLVVIYVQKVPK